MEHRKVAVKKRRETLWVSENFRVRSAFTSIVCYGCSLIVHVLVLVVPIKTWLEYIRKPIRFPQLDVRSTIVFLSARYSPLPCFRLLFPRLPAAVPKASGVVPKASGVVPKASGVVPENLLEQPEALWNKGGTVFSRFPYPRFEEGRGD